MTDKKCDCLNACGDDPRVGRYEVSPCEWRLQSAKQYRDKLALDVALWERARRRAQEPPEKETDS